MFKLFSSPLSKRFLLIVLFSLLFTALVMSLAAVGSIKRLGDFSARFNTENVESHMRSSLLSLAMEQAATRDAEFRAAMSTVRTTAMQAAQLLGDVDLFGRRPARGPERFTYHRDKGIFSNSREALVSSVYWDRDTMDPAVRKRMNAISHLDFLLAASKENSPGAVASWLMLSDSIVRYYPNIHLVDRMQPKTEFDCRDDHCFRLGSPAENPEGRLVWSDVYQDTVGQGLVVTVAMPVLSPSREFLGVTGMDFALDTVVRDVLGMADEILSAWNRPVIPPGGFSFLVDRDARIIALPRDRAEALGLALASGRDLEPGELLGVGLTDSENPEVRAMARTMIRGGSDEFLLTLDGKRYMAACCAMESTGWGLAIAVPRREEPASAREMAGAVESSVQDIILGYPPIAMGATLVSMGMVLLFIIRRLFSPMRSLLTAAQAVSRGQLGHRVDIPQDDEFGDLARAFNHMIDQLEKERSRLREAEESYRSIFENAVEGVFRSTRGGMLLSVNPAMAEILGYASPEQLIEEVRDMGSGLYVDPAERDQHLEQLEREGRSRRFETRLRRRDGSMIWGMFSARASMNPGGGIQYIDGLLEDVTEERKAEREVLRLTRELMQAQEGERRRIARDLHDDVAQILSSLRIGCGVLFDGYGDVPLEVRRRVDDFSDKLQECIASVRGMAYDLRPSALDELGLQRTLGQYCREFTERTDIETEFVSPGMDGVELTPDMEINFYRIIQEALHNVEKHARADHVSVSLVSSHPSVILLVTDNGRGFDPDRLMEDEDDRPGMGLSGMRERARLMGGDLEVRARPGVGVRLRVEVPVGCGNVGF